MAAQLVMRHVYNAKNELIREGLVPKDIANTREALMAYWEEEDARQAEAEAAEAEKRAAELSAPQEPGAAELVEPLAERLASAEAELETLRGLKTATPDAVLEGTMQIARAAGAAALVEAAGQTVIRQVDAAAAAADGQLKAIEGQVKATAEATGQLLVDGRESLERTQAEMLAKLTSSISKRISKFELDVAKMRGPSGARGRIGQGLIAGAGKRPEKRPDGSDWAPGDSWMNTKAEGFTLEYLAADGSWSQPARLVPAPKLINAQQNVLDMAPRNNISLSTVRAGGGSGGGGEKLLTDSAVKGGTVTIADSSNWTTAGHQNPKSGTVFVEVADANTGERGTVHAVIVTGNNVGDTRVTEFALLGSLFEKGAASPDVDIDALIGGAVVPPGLTGVSPLPGATRTLVKIRIGANLGTGGPYILSGMVFWNQRAEGRAIDLNQPSPQPAWIWA
jgi:hypothetical protein